MDQEILEGIVELHPETEFVFLTDGKVQIIGPMECNTIGGVSDIFRDIDSILNVPTRRDEVIARLAESHPAEKISSVMRFLEGRSFVVPLRQEKSDDALFDILDFRERYYMPWKVDQSKTEFLWDAKIDVVGTSAFASSVHESVSKIFKNTSLKRSHRHECDGKILVCTSTGSNLAVLREMNEFAVAAQRKIIFASMHGTKLAIGPFVQGEGTACFECYYLRLRANVVHVGEFDAKNSRDRQTKKQKSSVALSDLAASLVSIRLAALLSGTISEHPAGEIFDVDLLTCRTEFRRLLKVPRCPVCGAGASHRSIPDIYERKS